MSSLQGVDLLDLGWLIYIVNFNGWRSTWRLTEHTSVCLCWYLRLKRKDVRFLRRHKRDIRHKDTRVWFSTNGIVSISTHSQGQPFFHGKLKGLPREKLTATLCRGRVRGLEWSCCSYRVCYMCFLQTLLPEIVCPVSTDIPSEPTNKAE